MIIEFQRKIFILFKFQFFFSIPKTKMLKTEEISKKIKIKTGIHWFRHGLRLHDNPALVYLFIYFF